MSEHDTLPAHIEALYPEAVEFAQRRIGFSRRRLQEVLHVGFLTRDRLLLALIDRGVIRVSSNDRDYFLTNADA